ncbi:hypothetical protein [Actinomadura violacea]|uniref:Uncharacterized protein n=1 Tax=Actinomadura violacea TaxID=2819934 RepID=A0ABS3S019_9ACTN|nr:hypothetical protein [Actinomadura violacea]MBO2461649.1 hypothetical protein [Actinomadura violacea]
MTADARKAALLEALHMAPTRDWDDIVNAARCLRAERDELRRCIGAALPGLVRVAGYVSRGRGFVDVEPYPDGAARVALGALDDRTLRAATAAGHREAP